MTLTTTCGEVVDAKAIEVSFHIVDAMSPLNIILGRPTTNSLGAVISAQHLVLKYSLPRGLFGTIQGDQQITQEGYQNSMEIEKEKLTLVGFPSLKF